MYLPETSLHVVQATAILSRSGSRLTHGAVVAEPLPPRLDDLRGGRGAEDRGQDRHPHQVHRGGGSGGSAEDIYWHASLYYLPIYFRYTAT